MVHASIEHPPVLGGTVRSVDDKDGAGGQGRAADRARSIRSSRPTCSSRSAASRSSPTTRGRRCKGRKQLKVEWNDGAHASFESEAFKKQMLSTVSQPAKVARNLGNVDAEFAKGGKVLEATYYTPLAAHASMEPPAAVAEFRDGKVTIWAPTQNPQAVQDAVAAALGIDKKDVICHVTLLGGGFGRKSKPDYARKPRCCRSSSASR